MEIREFLSLPIESQRRLLKRLIYETVPKGDVKETAAAAGIEDYTLYKMRDENRENHQLIRPELLAILHHRQDLRLIYFILELFGYVSFRLPRAEATATELSREIARTVKAFGEHLEALTGALDDESPGGANLTSEEYRQIVITADTAIAQIAALKEQARLARGSKVVGEAQVRFGGKGQA